MRRALGPVMASVALLAACGGSTNADGQDASMPPPNDDSDGAADGTTMQPPTDDGGGMTPPDASGRDAPPRYDAGIPTMLACNQDPPPGAPQADALPTYAGQCPQLVPAPNLTTFTSSGKQRSFMVVMPKNLQPTEKLPVLFMWYWLKGNANDFYTRGDVQSATDQQRFIAVIPVAAGDLQFEWPFDIADTDARMNQEFQFFDDMLACVNHQFPTVNKNCVGTVGVSAGALFTDQLAAARANRLSSFMSFSGGVGGVIRPWGNPAHKLPAIVLWGGPTDSCLNLLNFQTESQDLENALTPQGDFLIECIHNCGHGEPPVVPPAPGVSTFAAFWNFVFDHPYWLAAGASPYVQTGLPNTFPSWCAIGQGNATIRTGSCPPPGC